MQTLRAQQSALKTTAAKQDQNIYEEVDVQSPIQICDDGIQQ